MSALRFAANLGFLFTEVPFAERFALAAECGFCGVEFMSPYESDPDELAERLHEHRLEPVLFNLPAGDWASGERGIACLPDRVEEFRAGVDLALRYAGRLGCTRLNCIAGLAPAGVDDNELGATLVANLRHAAPRCAQAGVRLFVEAINSRIDMPGFWLDTPAKALALIAEVGEPNLGLQFDVYHAQVMGGDALRELDACLPQVGHIQIADSPGRHQPGSGEIAWKELFRLLAERGYRGWIGCEYRPTGATADSLGWMRSWA